MTATAALAKHLLSGKKVSIKDGFLYFGITNIPRELSRGIEQKFGVKLEKRHQTFTSRYGRKGFYYEYKLPHTSLNKAGIKAMKKYVKDQELAQK